MKKIVFLLIFLSSLSGSITGQSNHPYWLNIIYIGNSITQGVQLENPRKNAPPVKASIYLHQQQEIGEVKYSNQGVSGSTTVDFLPETGTLFGNVKEVADKFTEDTWATLLFSIMLGTNDSAIEGPNGAPVSPKTYYRNMQTIINELLRLYPECIIILHRPVWYSENTYNSSRYLKKGLKRLESYYPQLKTLVKRYSRTYPHQVFLGDTEGFEFFKENPHYFIPEEGNAETFYLHPNQEGASKLGQLWGKAIYSTIKRQ
ncbi:MAG: GDSL-type esterase/lipase family protein [Tannerellaceae bacterium]|nr:GDSL-type esterase/lipase family protein [Tannerellaceae bacterium]